jgi:predicted nuclease with TOPRIM domain
MRLHRPLVSPDPPFEHMHDDDNRPEEVRLRDENRELRARVGDLRREKYELQEHVARLERERAQLQEMALKKKGRRRRRLFNERSGSGYA